MQSHWTEREFECAHFGDKRLNRRLIEVAVCLSETPESSIHQACLNWTDTKAAYRFFNNDSVHYQEILATHRKATLQRAKAFDTILAVQDTSYLNYSDHPKTTGLCPLSKHEGKHRRQNTTSGLVMHSTLAVTTQGLPIGLLEQKIYARKTLDEKEKNLKKSSQRNLLPIQKKDSMRWVEALEKTHASFASHSTQVVTVCDREGDMYDLFLRAHNLNRPLLVRAKNRVVNKSSTCSKKSGERLTNLFDRKKASGNLEICLPKSKDRPARQALCDVKVTRMTMTPPRNHAKPADGKLPRLSLYAVRVVEKKPPSGSDPVDWLLVTSMKVETLEQALEKVKWYCLRWRIEVFHKILKSGLRVEECRLADSARLIRYLALTSVIAWRIFWVTLTARTAPEASCLLAFNELEWKVLFQAANPKKKIPQRPPSVRLCVRWLAQLGGFLARKHDNEPGITSIWRGMRKLADMLEGLKMAQALQTGTGGTYG